MKKRLKNAEAVWNGKSLALTCNWRPSYFQFYSNYNSTGGTFASHSQHSITSTSHKSYWYSVSKTWNGAQNEIILSRSIIVSCSLRTPFSLRSRWCLVQHSSKYKKKNWIDGHPIVMLATSNAAGCRRIWLQMTIFFSSAQRIRATRFTHHNTLCHSAYAETNLR